MISGTRTLFNWSLKADTKAFSPHVVRAGFCGFMLLAVLSAWAESFGTTAPGLNFFDWICRLNVMLISASGISYFVSAVTEEKDSGTLALLRLAGVSPLAIVLSKSTSRLISSLMLLLIQMPFTFLSITLGGITWQQIVSSYLALAAWMCLVANVALFCSVRCRTSGRAATFATALLILFFASGPILSSIGRLGPSSIVSAELIEACQNLHAEQQMTSVVNRLDYILSGPTPQLFISPQFTRNVLAGATMFLLSVLLFNRYSDPQELNPHGSSAKVRRITVGRCWRFPVVWKDFLFFTGGTTLIFIKTILYCGLIAAFVWYHKLQSPDDIRWISTGLLETALLTVGGFMTIELLLYSTNILFMESRQRSIASLRMLPLSTPVLLLQKIGACVLAMSPAILTMFAILIYGRSSFREPGQLPEIFVAWLAFTLLSTHLTVLLSLYTKWAAMPIAILVSTISLPCLVGAAFGLARATENAAALNGIRWGLWVGVIVNLVWMWLFVLLPIEVEIVNRWNRLSRDS